MSLVPFVSLPSPVKAEAVVSLEGMKGLPGQTQQPAKQNMCITITNKLNEAQTLALHNLISKHLQNHVTVTLPANYPLPSNCLAES